MITFFRTRPIVAAIGLSALTVGIIGAALLTLASGGCGLGHSGRCASQNNLASLTTPSPTHLPTPSPFGGETPNPTSPATAPASAPQPPYSPPASSGPVFPNYNPASGLPFFPQSSSGGGSPYLPHQLSCSLPVYAGPSGSGGFITLPQGTFIADPKSNVTTPAVASQPGGASFGLAYDRAFSRWLPVPFNWMSPDEARYAFPTGDSIYAVTVATGAVTQLGQGRAWSLLDAANDGVYAGDAASGGLWFLPYAGSPSQITSSGYWQHVFDHKAAFGTATSQVPQGAANTIIRLDLVSHTTTDWFTRPGATSDVAGFDQQGNPIIYVGGTGVTSVWVATGAGSAKPLVNGGYPSAPIQGSPIADANGVWFSGYANVGIVLYTGTAFYGMSNIGGTLAGACS